MRPLIFAGSIALLASVGVAHAQVGGSYRQSCTDISQDGSMLSARCRGAGGQYVDSSIDVARCRGQGVANSNGRLTCGRVSGSARAAGSGGYDGNDQQQYSRPRYRQPGDDAGDYGYPRPRPRYRQPDDNEYGYAPPPPRPRYDYNQDDE